MKKAPCKLIALPLVISFIVFIAGKCDSGRLKTVPNFRCILVFGDSTVDTGNNNFVDTLFRANHLPYGQDLPGHAPKGRFSDGKLTPDIVASDLGIKEFIPPFLDPSLSNDDILTGVSFASAGSGFDDLTTKALQAIPVSKQVELFRSYILKLKRIVGEEEARRTINHALVIVSAGTNDFTFNFYDIPTRRLQYTISEYQDFVQQRIQHFLEELYELGCRTVIVTGLPPIGCIPFQMTLKLENPKERRCIEKENSDSQVYNAKLAELLPQIQARLPRSKLIYADVYEPLMDMINSPDKYGFMETKKGCCGTGKLEAAFLCNPTTPTCEKASDYLFFDSFHPSQAAYEYLARYVELQVLSKLLQHQFYLSNFSRKEN